MKNVHRKEKLKEKYSFSLNWPIAVKFNSAVTCSESPRATNSSPLEEPKDSIYGKSRLKPVTLSQTTSDIKHKTKTPAKQTQSATVGAFYASSSTFKLCGTEWKVSVYPGGVDEDGEYMAVHLISLANVAIRAAYCISIKNQAATGKDHSWSDPDGSVLFSSVQDGDNEWGCDDFIATQELSAGRNAGLTLNDLMVFEIEVEVSQNQNTMYSASEAAEVDSSPSGSSGTGGAVSAAAAALEQERLISQAKEEVHEVLKKLSKTRDVDVQKMQEDHIVKARLQQTAAPHASGTHSRASTATYRK